jgi:RNA polymerase sigma factor FliA
MDAVRKYDPSKKVQLKHYAEFRIRGAILDSPRLVDWSPRVLRRQARRIETAVNQCQARLGHDPSETEIAAEMQMNLASLRRLQNDIRGLDIESLQTDSEESSGRKNLASRAEASGENPYQEALRSEISGLLEKAIKDLPGREREVLSLYHL